jgi:hypothetical protein
MPPGAAAGQHEHDGGEHGVSADIGVTSGARLKSLGGVVRLNDVCAQHR